MTKFVTSTVEAHSNIPKFYLHKINIFISNFVTFVVYFITMISRIPLIIILAFISTLVEVLSEGISHSSHMMLKAAEKGDLETVINYVTKTGVPINVKNNYGVR